MSIDVGATTNDREPVWPAPDDWFSVTLFCKELPRHADDPDELKQRAAIIFGEGGPVTKEERPTKRIDKLGEGLSALSVRGPMSEIASALCQDHFDHNKHRFECALVRRPTAVGLPNERGLISAPISGCSRLLQFVRTEKASWLRGVVGEGEHQRARVTAMLQAVREKTGRHFEEDSLRWLGDVVVVERQSAPVYWTRELSPDGKSCRRILVVAPRPVSGLTVEVRVFGLDDVCLRDTLVTFDGEPETKIFDFLEEVGSVLLRAWSQGELVSEAHTFLNRGVNGKILAGRGSFSLQDRLTSKLEKAIAGGAASSDQLEKARRGGGRGFAVGFATDMKHEPWVRASVTQRELFDLERGQPPPYSFFPVGAAGRAEAVLSFAKLISGAETAYLADPWFDSEGAVALLPRVTGDGELTVVTNLSVDHEATRDGLERTLHQLGRGGFAHSLKVVCLVAKRTQKQVFHDRYLLTRTGDRWRAFVVTNSFSGMATDYPLFVIEVPSSVVGLMLDEFEGLLSGTHTTRLLWPPPPAPRTETDELRRFPYSSAVLAGVVPHPPGASARLPQLASNLGYLLLREDSWSWRTDPDRTAEIVDWLISRPRRPGVFARGSRRKGRGRMHRPFSVGKGVHILGDLAASGLQIESRQIAQRVSRSAADLEAELRRSFLEPKDPAVAGPGSSRDRLLYRQFLRADVSSLEGTHVGVELWMGRGRYHHRKGTWARTFAYSVLAQIAPRRAVALAEELFDADFVLALVDSLHGGRTAWSESLALALIHSNAAVLRGIGLQSLAWGRMTAETTPEDVVPADIAGVVSRLKGVGVDTGQIARLLQAWGQKRPEPSVNPGRDLGKLLLEVPADERDGLVRDLFDANRESANLNGAVADGLFQGWERSRTECLSLMGQTYCARFTDRSDRYFFTEALDVPKAVVAGRIFRRLAQHSEDSPWTQLADYAKERDLRRDVRPLSPYRHRPGAAVADMILGQVILIDLMANGLDFSGNYVGLSDEPRRRADEYLGSPQLGRSKDVRDCISRFLEQAPREAEEEGSQQ